MNVVFKDLDKVPVEISLSKRSFVSKFWFPFVFTLLVVVFILMFFHDASLKESSLDVLVNASVSHDSYQSVIDPIAESYGIPTGYMNRLADYITLNRDMFSGVGLFSVHSVDLGWIQGGVLSETKIDLNNDVQNAQVAAYLLKRFYDAGYSWRESFLIYAFGFPAIHDSNHNDFEAFVGFSE